LFYIGDQWWFYGVDLLIITKGKIAGKKKNLAVSGCSSPGMISYLPWNIILKIPCNNDSSNCNDYPFVARLIGFSKDRALTVIMSIAEQLFLGPSHWKCILVFFMALFPAESLGNLKFL
jgi:hypothetical protein